MLEGDPTKSAIFYRPPDKIEGNSVGVIITVNIMKSNRQYIKQTILLKIVSVDSPFPSHIKPSFDVPKQLIVSIPNDEKLQPMLIALNSVVDYEPAPAAIPEPNSYLLFLIGLSAIVINSLLKRLRKNDYY